VFDLFAMVREQMPAPKGRKPVKTKQSNRGNPKS
jgi:hypothetical protein